MREKTRQGQGPLVTVIVPVYKVEPYLEQCVDSIRSQTYQNLEIILVDDGSPDNCPILCDDCAAQDPRIVVIHKENGGLSSARNAALDVMKGEYVTFIDSDDFVAPELVERLVALAEKYQCDMVRSKDYVVRERAVCPIPRRAEVIELRMGRELLQDFYTPGLDWSISVMQDLYRAELFSGLRFPEGMIYEDTALWFPLLWRCGRVVRTNQRYYYYYFSPNSIMRSAFSRKNLDSLKVFQMQEAFCREHGLTELGGRVKVEHYRQLIRLIYEVRRTDWPDKEQLIQDLDAQRKAKKPEAVSIPYYSGKMRAKDFLFQHMGWLAEALIQKKQTSDRKKLFKGQ